MTAAILPLAATTRAPCAALFDCACDLEPGMLVWREDIIAAVAHADRLSVQVRLQDGSLTWWPSAETMRVTYRWRLGCQ